MRQGFYLGLIGSISGVVLGFLVSLLLQNFKIINLPHQYYVEKLPVIYDPYDYAFIFFTSLIICILAGVYPAITASKLQPLQGLRRVIH